MRYKATNDTAIKLNKLLLKEIKDLKRIIELQDKLLEEYRNNAS